MFAFTKRSPSFQEFMRLVSYKPLQYIITTCVVGLLMFFLTLMVGMMSHLSDVSEGLTDKLGMFFYITDDLTGDALNTQVLALIKELDNADIHAEYLSQEDATQALKKRLPEIVDQFDRYDIDAQLPSTLYISMRNKGDRDTLIKLLPKYSSLITNVDDLSNTTSLKGQEQRVIKAIDFAYFLKNSSVVLIIFFACILSAVVVLLLYFKLKQFENLLALKKIIGASYAQLRTPFVVFSTSILGGGLILSFVFTLFLALVNTGKAQSLVYFSQLLGLESLNQGIWGLLFSNYATLLLIVIVCALIIWIISSIMIERKIRTLN